MTNHTITIFGNARVPPDSEEYTAAYQLGNALAQNNFRICNGGYGGIMEASAKGAKDAGGKTCGVTVATFPRAHNAFLDEVFVKESLIARMLQLVEIGDAYIILPGGTGTLLEFATVWELEHKRLMKEKPIILSGKFWHPVVQLFENETGFFGEGKITDYITQCASERESVQFLKEYFSSMHPK
jgi:uncharacterized protein (TIGR00725 family)